MFRFRWLHGYPRRTVLGRSVSYADEMIRYIYDPLIRTYDFADINQMLADTQSGEVVKPVLIMN